MGRVAEGVWVVVEEEDTEAVMERVEAGVVGRGEELLVAKSDGLDNPEAEGLDDPEEARVGAAVFVGMMVKVGNAVVATGLGVAMLERMGAAVATGGKVPAGEPEEEMEEEAEGEPEGDPEGEPDKLCASNRIEAKASTRKRSRIGCAVAYCARNQGTRCCFGLVAEARERSPHAGRPAGQPHPSCSHVCTPCTPCCFPSSCCCPPWRLLLTTTSPP